MKNGRCIPQTTGYEKSIRAYIIYMKKQVRHTPAFFSFLIWIYVYVLILNT